MIEKKDNILSGKGLLRKIWGLLRKIWPESEIPLQPRLGIAIQTAIQ